MTGSYWFFAWRQIARRRTKIQRLLKSCSVTENSIEWIIKWKKDTIGAFLIHSLWQQVLLSNQSVVFIYWSAGNLQGSMLLFLSFHVGRYLGRENVKEKWDFRISWNWCKMKILMKLSPSVKTAYLEIS